MKRKYTPVIEKLGSWYVACVKELPGLRRQGRSRAEALRTLDEALELGTKANLEFASREKVKSVRRKVKRRR